MNTNNYKDIVSLADSIFHNRKDKCFKLKINSTNLKIIEVNASLDEIQELLDYTFEYAEIKDFFYQLFEEDPSTANFEKVIICNSANHYQFIMNYKMLDLLLTAEWLKGKNIPLVSLKQIPKKNGKMRQLVIPEYSVRNILKDINKVLQRAYDNRNSEFQVAYKCGKSIKNAAEKHKDKKYMFKMDISSFFPSCKREIIQKYVLFLFKNTVNQDFLCNKFLDIILYDDALYIGNPVSGTLANVTISKPVEYIYNICKKFGITYTVYADDMIFGSDKFITKKFIVSIYNKAFTKYNMEDFFILNDDKLYGLSGTNRSAVGVSFNQNNEMVCHRYIYNNIRMTLHQLSYGDESHFKLNEIIGQIAFATMIDESGKVQKLIKRYKDVCIKYNILSEAKIESM